MSGVSLTPQKLKRKVRRLRGGAAFGNSMSKVVEVEILPANLITKEELARRLRPDDPPKKGIQWVREKVSRRCPNPMPCYNLGRHLMFNWPDVCEWIKNLPRPVHAPHRRRVDRRQADRRQAE